MTTFVGHARVFTVHWADLAKCLPISNDQEGYARRRDLYEMFDPPGHGILYKGTVVRALFRMMPQVSGISDMKVVVHEAWNNCRDLVSPVTPIGIDRMDRNQFRVFCIYLWYYFKLWDVFVQLNDMGTKDRKVTRITFEEMMPYVRDWGVPDAEQWGANSESVFDNIDRSGKGWVIFDDLAEFVLRRAVPVTSANGEEECREEAIRLLKRTHPHLMDKPRAIPKKDYQVCPPGQRRPPMQVELEGIREGGMTSPKARRFKTQYMCDYMSPAYIPDEVTTASTTPARSRALSRALTPRPVRYGSQAALKPPSDLNVGIGLIRSSSMPDATMRTQGLDKGQLRSKLENHLDMYSTGQMRKLLKVAGGMVVGPGSPKM
jgi:hypothetical protein